jgi:hypothetical protein
VGRPLGTWAASFIWEKAPTGEQLIGGTAFSRGGIDLAHAGAIVIGPWLAAIMVQHEQANGGRQLLCFRSELIAVTRSNSVIAAKGSCAGTQSSRALHP